MVLLRLCAATLAMAIVVLCIMATPLSDVLKLIIAIPTGALTFLVMGRALTMLGKDDRHRLQMLSSFVPMPARRPYNLLVDFLVPATPLEEASR